MPTPLSVISEQSLINLFDRKSKEKTRERKKSISDTFECNSLNAFSINIPKSIKTETQEDIYENLNEYSLYEKQLIDIIDKLFDIDCTSNLLYIDHKSDAKTRQHWRYLMEKKFCLLNSIKHLSCLSDVESSETTRNMKRNEFQKFNDKIIYGLNGSPNEKLYDLIIIKNCIQNFSKPDDLIKTLFDNYIIDSLDKGTVLVIQRSYKYNCLPFYDSLDNLWMTHDFNLNEFIDKLKVHKLDVAINIEEIDCNMSKTSWLLSLNNHQIYPLNFLKMKLNIREDNTDGVRQICEGIFKYNEDIDRMKHNVNYNANSRNYEFQGYVSNDNNNENNFIFRDRLMFLTIKRSDNYLKLEKFKKQFLIENRFFFKNIDQIQDTVSNYFDHQESSRGGKSKSNKVNKTNKSSNVKVEDDVMDILFEIDPSLEGKIFGSRK